MKLYLKICSCVALIWGILDLIQFFATDSMSAIQRLNAMTQFDVYVVSLIVIGVIKAVLLAGGGFCGFRASNDNEFYLEYAYMISVVLLPLVIVNAFFAITDVINPTALLSAAVSLGVTIVFYTLVSYAKKNRKKIFH